LASTALLAAVAAELPPAGLFTTDPPADS
jgi:hypothetical protein